MWLQPNFDAMLPELKALPNWVLAKAVQRQGKLTKVPHHPNGPPASVSDPETWSSFDQVKAAYGQGIYIGVGFVLDGNPHFDGKYLHGFDWDHCIADGKVDSAVKAQIDALDISRIEISISGTGLRGFFLHEEKLPSRKNMVDGRSVELYSGRRYLTTTGLAFGGKELLLWTANIAAINALFPPRAPAHTGVVGNLALTFRGPVPYDAFQAFPGGWTDRLFPVVIESVRTDPVWGPVYSGDLSRYQGDHSAADLALCGKFARLGLTPELIDMAMRTSQLYRDKWERGGYRAHTIGLAVGAQVPPVPSPPPPSLLSVSLALLAPANGRVDAGMSAPAPRDWLIDGMLLTGVSAVLAGLGGVSKTQWSLQLSIAVATGSQFAGRKTQSGKVLFLSGEEDREELQRRINAVIRHGQLSATEIDQIRDNMFAYPLVGEDIRLTATRTGTFEETGFASEIIEAANALGDVRLIILDHAGLVHGGQFNAKEDVALTMRVINGITHRTGAAVILLAHSPKSAVNAEEADVSMIAGSTAFVDQSRGGWILATMGSQQAKALGISQAARKDYAALTGVKANYTPNGQEFWFKRVSFDEVGVLEHVTLVLAIKQAKSGATLSALILQEIGQAPGRYSKTKMRDTFQGKKAGTWNASKAEIESCADDLLQHGHLVSRLPTAEERKLYSHGPQVKQVLDLPNNPGTTI